jgi:hypothetical protein
MQHVIPRLIHTLIAYRDDHATGSVHGIPSFVAHPIALYAVCFVLDCSIAGRMLSWLR